jgi:hypothetical protein
LQKKVNDDKYFETEEVPCMYQWFNDGLIACIAIIRNNFTWPHVTLLHVHPAITRNYSLWNKNYNEHSFCSAMSKICLCGSLVAEQWIVEWSVQFSRRLPVPMLLLICIQHVAEYILSINYSEIYISWNELTKHPIAPFILCPTISLVASGSSSKSHSIAYPCVYYWRPNVDSRTVAVPPAKSC